MGKCKDCKKPEGVCQCLEEVCQKCGENLVYDCKCEKE